MSQDSQRFLNSKTYHKSGQKTYREAKEILKGKQETYSEPRETYSEQR